MQLTSGPTLRPIRGHHDSAWCPTTVHLCIRLCRGADSSCNSYKLSFQGIYLCANSICIRDACVFQHTVLQFRFQVVPIVDYRPPAGRRQFLDCRPQPRMLQHQHVRLGLFDEFLKGGETLRVISQNFAVRQVIELPDMLVARRNGCLVQIDDWRLIFAVCLPRCAVDWASDHRHAGGLQRFAGLMCADLPPVARPLRWEREKL